MKIVIQNALDLPIYQQVEEQIKSAILAGELKEGDLLPSIRQLAKDLKISVITTTRAYTELEKSGYVAIVQGKGCFVSPTNSQLIHEQLLKEIEADFEHALKTATIAKLTKEELKTIFLVMIEEDEK